jgi:hypothetical protein
MTQDRAPDEGLPPLPEPTLEDVDYEIWGQNSKMDCYSEEQMRMYAQAALQAERERLTAQLKKPEAVHAAMLRGEIATPDIRTMLHVYGETALAKWDGAERAEQDQKRYQFLRARFACHWSTYEGDTVSACFPSVGVECPRIFGKVGDPPPTFDIDAAIDRAIANAASAQEADRG